MPARFRKTGRTSAGLPEELPLSREKPKRRKISQACEQCRTRKSRCDGAKPACRECTTRPNQATRCHYSVGQIRGTGYDEYVTTLLARIDELESQQPSNPTLNCHSMPAQEHFSDTASQSYGQMQAPASPDDILGRARTPLENTSPVDAMGADIVSDAIESQQQSKFYGGSSATALMRQIYQAVGSGPEDSRAASPLPILQQQGLSYQNNTGWSAASIEHFSLLPRPLTDGLLNIYWCKVHHLYPFVHKPTFMLSYERLWTSQGSREIIDGTECAILGSSRYGHNSYIFHCALNVMLGLAIELMDTPPGDRAKLAEIFSLKSRNLCRLDLFDDGSLASIQTLLLMTMHLQSTPFPNRCWNCIGIACRLAQGMGLHIESSKLLAEISPFELEIRRRIWHGCILLDTIVSTTLGRPMMLHNFTPLPPPLPSPIDDEYLSTPQSQPMTKPPWILFYIESIKLYDILADIIASVYGRTNIHPSSSEKEASIEEISKFDTAISRLENSLPFHLRPESQPLAGEPPAQQHIFQQQSYVLQARFLHLRLLLYRPTFLRFWHRHFVRKRPESLTQNAQVSIASVTLALDQSISIACVQTSLKLVESVVQSASKSAAGAWWYSLLYIRMAGTIIVLARCSDTVVSSVGKDKLDSAYESCLSLLEDLVKYSSSVSRAVHQLRRTHRFLLRSNKNGIDHSGVIDPTDLVQRSSTGNSTELSMNTRNAIDMTEQHDNSFFSENTIFEGFLGQDAENWMIESLGIMPTSPYTIHP